MPRPPLLIDTKLQPPRRSPRWVARGPQLALLDAALDRKLTVVTAPAGFGKTTLLADWCHALREREGHAAAWLALEDDDDDLPLFGAYAVEALHRAAPAVAARAARMLADDPLAPVKLVLTLLLNDTAAHPGQVVLILDDADRLRSDAIRDLLFRLLRHAPPNLHVVAAGRREPALPLSFFRMREQLAQVDVEALRFDAGQAREFFERAGGGDLSDPEAERLCDATEGWFAGLQLAALSRGDPAGGRRPGARDLDAYLADHVLAALADSDRDFVLACAVPDRITAPLAQALTGRADAADRLDQLEAGGLFLRALDDEGRWYRFHALFRESMLRRLARRDEAVLAGLHASVARWFATQALWPDAIRHALVAGDEASAAEWVERCAMERVESGDARTVLAWVARLPPAAVALRPRLRLAAAWASAMSLRTTEAAEALRGLREDLDAGRTQLQEGGESEILAVGAVVAALNDDSVQALRLATTLGDRTGAAGTWMAEMGRTVTLYALLAAGRFDDVRQLSAPATSSREPGAAVHGRAYRRSMVGAAALASGDLREAGRLLEAAVADASGHTGPLSAAATLPAGYLALLRYEWNDLGEAGQLVQDRLEIAEETAPLGSLTAYLLVASRLALLRGDADAARELLARGDALAERRGWTRMRVALAEDRIRLELRDGRLAPALQLLGALEARLPAQAPAERCALTEAWLGLQACRARVALATGREADAIASLERQVADWQAAGMLWREARSRILLAVARAQAGDPAEAARQLALVLAEGQRHGIVRSIVDEGEPARRLVHALQRERSPALPAWYAGSLLAAWGTAAPAEAPASAASRLSAREVEILDFIAQGLSNKEIARALRVAPETVKWHLKNIYEKLNVSTRVQAVQCGLGVDLPRSRG